MVLLLLIAGAVYFFFIRGSGELSPDEKDPHANTIAANTLNCGLSVPAEEGDYYISGAPKLKKGNLNKAKLNGENIRIIGYVYDGESKDKKVPRAEIEIWQPDSIGVFHPAESGEAGDFGKKQLALRGTAVADKFGYFEFDTIYPGETEGRSRHIYIKAAADGYESLTTQLVTSRSGDSVATGDDPVAQSLPNCNDMYFGAVEGMQTAAYDFHLVSAPDAPTASE